ncbi:hypothetical protein EJ05DRAFT_497681 [Pseudovirgaria hyperparasitica]|uniref:Uncharacterized protein n=1 Tax=Pseudovirgaria hyperparasitica TaxID=470096 RepID=A0A6A6WE71_9PEZI|nr:uncharacterized protein EJ05DRAFT_497681 [Pseudovirgaria hyperparasitica]KAF2761122.1 hypothetical protein EJ05DRAFT_497681 [Pseudovirgaria hyperparasitica]
MRVMVTGERVFLPPNIFLCRRLPQRYCKYSFESEDDVPVPSDGMIAMEADTSPSKKRFDAIRAKWEKVATPKQENLQSNKGTTAHMFNMKRLPQSLSEPNLPKQQQQQQQQDTEPLQSRIKRFTSIANLTTPLSAITSRARRRDPQLLLPPSSQSSNPNQCASSTAIVIRQSPVKAKIHDAEAMISSPKKHQNTLPRSATTSNLPVLARSRPVSGTSLSSSLRSANAPLPQSRIPTPGQNAIDQRSAKLAAAGKALASIANPPDLTRSLTQPMFPSMAMPSRFITPRPESSRREQPSGTSLRGGGGSMRRTSSYLKRDKVDTLGQIKESSDMSGGTEDDKKDKAKDKEKLSRNSEEKDKTMHANGSRHVKSPPSNEQTPKAKYHLIPQQNGRDKGRKHNSLTVPQLRTPRAITIDTKNDLALVPVTAKKLQVPSGMMRHASVHDMIAQPTLTNVSKPELPRSHTFSGINNFFKSSRDSIGSMASITARRRSDSRPRNCLAGAEDLDVENIPREVHKSEDNGYWCGRLCTIDNRLRDEGTMYSHRHAARDDDARLRKAFRELKGLCKTEEATSSLRRYMHRYATTQQNMTWVMQELPREPKRTPIRDADRGSFGSFGSVGGGGRTPSVRIGLRHLFGRNGSKGQPA